MDKKKTSLIEFFFVDLPKLTMVGKEYEIDSEERVANTPFLWLEDAKHQFDLDFRGNERYMYCDTCFAWTGERAAGTGKMKYMIGKVFKKPIDLPNPEYTVRSFGDCKVAEGIVKSEIGNRVRLCHDAHRLMAAKLNSEFGDYEIADPIWSVEMYTPDYFYETSQRKHAVMAYFIPVLEAKAS